MIKLNKTANGYHLRIAIGGWAVFAIVICLWTAGVIH
jgi:hypothetical protein